jgi:hypothetical protein
MSSDLTGLAALVAALVLSTVSAPAQDVSPCRSRSVNVEHANNVLKSDVAGGLLCMQGSQAAVRLEVHQTTIAAVLSTLLIAYKVSYRSPIALNETRDGVYAGSLRQVISRLLDGYDYVIKRENSTFDVLIFGKTGEQAVSAPIATEVSENPVRRAAVSRNH